MAERDRIVALSSMVGGHSPPGRHHLAGAGAARGDGIDGTDGTDGGNGTHVTHVTQGARSV